MTGPWDSSFKDSPAGTGNPGVYDQNVRDTRSGPEERFENEHTFLTGSVGGDVLHKAGSAKSYHQASEPTLRPDGVTSLDSDDAGRLLRTSGGKVLKVYSGSAWGNALVGAEAFAQGVLTKSSDPLNDTFLGHSISGDNFVYKTSGGVYYARTGGRCPIFVMFAEGTVTFYVRALSVGCSSASIYLYRDHAGAASLIGTYSVTSSSTAFTTDTEVSRGDVLHLGFAFTPSSSPAYIRYFGCGPLATISESAQVPYLPGSQEKMWYANKTWNWGNPE